MIKPVLKWVGGKRRLMKKIEDLMPSGKIGNYYEPFFGGGSVLFSLEDKIKGKIFINDFNKDLVNVYKQVVKNPDKLVVKLKVLKKAYLKVKNKRLFYNKKRLLFNRGKVGRVMKAALYIFLNKTNFNGIMVKDKRGNIVAGWGKHEKPVIFEKDNIYNVSSMLKTRKVSITNNDYEKVLKKAKRGDFVFMDPPYVPDDITKWKDRYLKDRWTMKDFNRTFDVFDELTRRGCKVMFTNSWSSVIRKRFSNKKKYRLVKVPIKRTISRTKSRRVVKYEVIIMNYSKKS